MQTFIGLLILLGIVAAVIFFRPARRPAQPPPLLSQAELTSRLRSAEADASYLSSRVLSLEQRVGETYGWESIASRLQEVEDRLAAIESDGGDDDEENPVPTDE